VRLPADLIRQAQALGRREGATLFMVLLGGFQALLARYTGQRDLAVGTPIAGRNRVEIEGLIGFFVNTLVLRCDLTGAPSFRELLGRVRETTLAGHTHQDLPFDKLVQELTPERSLAHTPLFQVMFALQNAPAESLVARDLRLRPVTTSDTTAKFDLTINLQDWNGEVVGAAQYATDLFDGPTINRLILHYERLLTAALASPELRLSELPLIGDAERHQLLTEWGGMGGQPPEASTLHGSFEMQARWAPGAAALTWKDATLTYGELNRRANQLARWLRGRGVGPESRVGLCLDRSPELVVGILGVLKAGAAYVPLDPGYPRERLAYMIEDAGVEVLVGTEASMAGLPETAGGRILLDEHRGALEGLPAGDLEPLSDGAGLAYVIYTSGSTGRPKGVLVSHGHVARLFAATRAWFGFGECDVWSLFHSYAFDFSVWEIWGALLHGGRLVVMPYEVSRSPELFLDLLRRERVTVLNQTPSAFAQLARADEALGEALTDLRLVIFGGEELDPASLAPWFARHGDERPLLVNMYGITETTVHVTYRPMRTPDAWADRRSAIGFPIPDLTVAVLGPDLRPVPIGVPGELVVGGAGVARGYLGRPGLTAERFVPDTEGARLYRSGDLGRFLPSGELEYLGRIDHQVKIRGFRIELGEIESLLRTLEGVREAVVAVREDVSGDRRLAAYVVGGAAAETLRGMLRERLPDYMVPAVFVHLPALPLTPNGKVDRKALPDPERQSAGESHHPPRTPLEEFLAGLWRDALGVESVGVHDSFFDLGGSSLTGVILINRLQREMGRIIHVVVLFDAPTVAKMA
ncbi:MAG TPA: amino acid adenylation domain-containing protein, partial [Thermoanaerobaculia bacterium]